MRRMSRGHVYASSEVRRNTFSFRASLLLTYPPSHSAPANSSFCILFAGARNLHAALGTGFRAHRFAELLSHSNLHGTNRRDDSGVIRCAVVQPPATELTSGFVRTPPPLSSVSLHPVVINLDFAAAGHSRAGTGYRTDGRTANLIAKMSVIAFLS